MASLNELMDVPGLILGFYAGFLNGVLTIFNNLVVAFWYMGYLKMNSLFVNSGCGNSTEFDGVVTVCVELLCIQLIDKAELIITSFHWSGHWTSMPNSICHQGK